MKKPGKQAISSMYHVTGYENYPTQDILEMTIQQDKTGINFPLKPRRVQTGETLTSNSEDSIASRTRQNTRNRKILYDSKQL